MVSVQLGGWDTHTDNWSKLKNNNLPKLDAGLSGLLVGLEQRGLLESTAVFVTGEFGRTPKINTRSAEGGRDHYPRCMFMLMAGGAVRGGQVIGKAMTRPPVHVTKVSRLMMWPQASTTTWASIHRLSMTRTQDAQSRWFETEQ